MNKIIVNFDNHIKRGQMDALHLGESISICPQNSVSQHAFNTVNDIEHNVYATLFTLALPTQGWSNRLKKHNPTIEEQSDYFENNLNNIVFTNKNIFKFMYSLEYNADMANIHCHGVIHQSTNADLNRFKKELRKIFKLSAANRVAVKYYKSEPQLIPIKYMYHLGDTNYHNSPKDKVHSYYTSVSR